MMLFASPQAGGAETGAGLDMVVRFEAAGTAAVLLWIVHQLQIPGNGS